MTITVPEIWEDISVRNKDSEICAIQKPKCGQVATFLILMGRSNCAAACSKQADTRFPMCTRHKDLLKRLHLQCAVCGGRVFVKSVWRI